MKKAVSTFLLILCIADGLAQGTEPKQGSFFHPNSVQLEFFSFSAEYALNYERTIFNRSRFKTLGLVGVCRTSDGYNFPGLTIPIALNELFSFNRHHAEFGLTYNHFLTWYANDVSSASGTYYVSGRIAYRYQKPNGRFIFRLSYAPVLYANFLQYFRDRYKPPVNISIGYAFGK
ncbi:MAG TPA: hypothetical protein PLQ93_04465 [Bacteroidia bacterium]|nr:hypothetical protein [Bacteroidia bacterium]